jgi:hypothetical protein
MAPRAQVVRDAHLAPLLAQDASDASQQQPSARDATAPAAPPEEPLSGAPTPPSAAAPPRDVRDAAGSPAAERGSADATRAADAPTQLGDLSEDLAQARSTATAIRQLQSLTVASAARQTEVLLAKFAPRAGDTPAEAAKKAAVTQARADCRSRRAFQRAVGRVEI